MIRFKQFLAEKNVGAPKLLLAKEWKGQDITGWWLSEKLDGVRAYWDGKMFVSRNGNQFFSPKWFTEGFPNFPMDGELFVGRKQFDKAISTVKKLIPVDDQWKKIKYHIFDLPKAGGGFESRLSKMKQLDKHPNIHLVQQTKVKNNEQIEKLLIKVSAAGAEGLMVREKGSMYVGKRSSTLLKLKIFHDAEAEVIDHQDGTGKYVGMMGALICKDLESGVKFRVGTGFKDAQRKSPPPIGAIITYKYQEKTKKGMPRFPAFLRMADKI